MLISPTGTFHDYVERRRLRLTRRSQRHHGWGLLLGALALYPGLCSLLELRPRWVQFSQAWLVTTIPVSLVGMVLYLLGTYLLTVVRQQQQYPRQSDLGLIHRLAWRRFFRYAVSLPYLAVTVLLWLALSVWGEMLAPLLVQRIPQLMAGVVISLGLAGGHWWVAGQNFWIVESQQLWTEYLQELRQSFLLPYYQHLERSRQSVAQYRQMYEDLRLEEVEAYHLMADLQAQMQRLNQAPKLMAYAEQVGQSCQRLSQLLYQLEEGIQVLEMMLADIETELELNADSRGLGIVNLLDENLERLKEMDLQSVLSLSQDLVVTEQSLRGVTREMDQLLAQPTASLATWSQA